MSMKTKEQVLSEILDASTLPTGVIDKIYVAMEKWASEVEAANRAASKPYSPSLAWGETDDR